MRVQVVVCLDACGLLVSSGVWMLAGDAFDDFLLQVELCLGACGYSESCVGVWLLAWGTSGLQWVCYFWVLNWSGGRPTSLMRYSSWCLRVFLARGFVLELLWFASVLG